MWINEYKPEERTDLKVNHSIIYVLASGALINFRPLWRAGLYSYAFCCGIKTIDVLD